MKRKPAAADPSKKDASDALPDESTQASPYKSAGEELDILRRTFRSVCEHYAQRIDQEITQLREHIVAAGEREMAVASPKRPGARRSAREGSGQGRLYDLRDIISLLRTLEVKPVAGRRKDLKKIESLVEELRLLVERWD